MPRRRAPPVGSERMEAVGTIARDVEQTIRHWQNRGVTVWMIAAELRCHHSWPAVRGTMIAIEMNRADLARRLAA